MKKEDEKDADAVQTSTTEEDRKAKFLKSIGRWLNWLCFLSYLGGIFYFLALVYPAFSNKTYFSENALLPGLVEEEFSKFQLIAEFSSQIKQITKKSNERYSMPVEWIREQFESVGLESYVHNFSVHLSVAQLEKLHGSNVYAILRASRTSPSEAIVISTPYRMESFGALAVILSLAAFCREQVYWAKDIIFVVAEHEEIGMQAWLSAYHQRNIPALSTEPLQAHSGAIQAAVSLEVTGTATQFSHADIKYNMVNGQLPNLDLVNLMVRMVEKEGTQATIFRQEDAWQPFSQDGYLQLLGTSLYGLVAQASGKSNGLHGLFGSYGIEAVTVEAYQREGARNRQAGLLEVGRVLEGALRSVNNLLERFHQSYFFYLLLSSQSFISIGLYMPAVGLVLLGPLLKACFLWMQLNDLDQKSRNGTDQKSLKQEESAGGKTNPSETEKVDYSLLGVSPYMVLAHIFGIVVYNLPSIVQPLMRPRMNNADLLLTGSSGFMVALFFFPWLMNNNNLSRKAEGSRMPSVLVLRTVALLELALILGVTSVMNFGLGFLLAVISVPVCMIIYPTDSSVRYLFVTILIVLLNPLIVLFLWNIGRTAVASPVFPGFIWAFTKSYSLTKQSLVTLVVDSWLFGSWFLAAISLGIIPLWVLFWTILHHPLPAK